MLDVKESSERLAAQDVVNNRIDIMDILALTRKICGILSKKLQKLALFKLSSNVSVKTTVFCYIFAAF